MRSALFVAVVLVGSAHAESDVKNPFGDKPATRPAAAKPEKTALQRPEAPKADKPDADKAPTNKKSDKNSDKNKAAATLAAITPQPNEFTNDPILGRASRITGTEVSGMIAFTFDDGPNTETTPAVLDALKQYDVPATFFVVTQRLAGKHGEKPRALLARTMTEGHLIASHSVSHPYLGKAKPALLDKEIDASFKALAEHTLRPIGLFRAPFGALNDAGRTRLRKLGVTEAFWSIDTLDWKAKDATKLRQKAATMIEKQNGGVILWHDVKPITAKVIGDVLDDLEAVNCKRLAAKQEPIWPVSIHYFLRDGKEPRAIPEDVKKRTAAYKAALPGRCAKRSKPAADGGAGKDAKAAQGAAKDAGAGQEPAPVLDDRLLCNDNPLAKGCP
jgi:peptidoglycan/xylan/chitin deacetylase (PgdA/CDA1 family)